MLVYVTVKLNGGFNKFTPAALCGTCASRTAARKEKQFIAAVNDSKPRRRHREKMLALLRQSCFLRLVASLLLLATCRQACGAYTWDWCDLFTGHEHVDIFLERKNIYWFDRIVASTSLEAAEPFGRRVRAELARRPASKVTFAAGTELAGRKNEYQKIYWRCSGSDTIGETLLPAGSSFSLMFYVATKPSILFMDNTGRLEWDVCS